MSTGAEITAMGGVDVVHEDSMEYEYPEQDPVDASDMENDYDDPVLKEFDVFFAPSSHLHLLQFPNRTAAFPYPPTASSYKPLSHKFKMDYALSGVRDHYSTDQARDLTLGLEEDPMNPKGLQEISYVSSVIPFTASYMMGCIKESTFFIWSCIGFCNQLTRRLRRTVPRSTPSDSSTPSFTRLLGQHG